MRKEEITKKEINKIIELKYSFPVEKWLLWIKTKTNRKDFISFDDETTAKRFIEEFNLSIKRRSFLKSRQSTKRNTTSLKSKPMKNITISIVELHDKAIQFLIKLSKIDKRFEHLESRSHIIRLALKEYLNCDADFSINLIEILKEEKSLIKRFSGLNKDK